MRFFDHKDIAEFILQVRHQLTSGTEHQTARTLEVDVDGVDSGSKSSTDKFVQITSELQL
jgi:hypothetical protein